MPSRTRSCGTTAVISLPSRIMLPAVGLSTPVSKLITVVLPAPFGPIKAWRAPFSIDSETSCAATMPPKRFSRPIVSRIGMASTPLRRSAANGGRTLYEAGGKAGAQCRRPLLHPFAADQHDHDQHEADPELPVLRREAGDPVLQEFVDHGADQAAIEIAGAADDQDQKKIGRAFERQHVKRAEGGRLREEAAGNAGESGGCRIDHDQPAVDGNTDRGSPERIAFQRAQRQAERRIDDTPGNNEAHKQDGEAVDITGVSEHIETKGTEYRS